MGTEDDGRRGSCPPPTGSGGVRCAGGQQGGGAVGTQSRSHLLTVQVNTVVFLGGQEVLGRCEQEGTEASAQDSPSDGVQGGLNDCGANEGRGIWTRASGAFKGPGLGVERVRRVDGSHLSNRLSRAACPEVEPTVGSRFCDLGGESKRRDIASLRCFSISTREPEQARLGHRDKPSSHHGVASTCRGPTCPPGGPRSCPRLAHGALLRHRVFTDVIMLGVF